MSPSATEINSDTHCTLPTKQLAFRHYENGKLKNAWPCCNMMIGGNVDFGITDVHLLTPQEIFDHPSSEELRTNLANGNRDTRCQVCWNMEDKGLKSYRQRSLDDKSADNWAYGLRSVDLRISNLCNLRCRMCDPKWSHSLMIDYRYLEQNGLLGITDEAIGFRWKPTKKESNPADDDLQWRWLMENTHQINNIRASGGEPLYDSRMLNLLRHYVATGAASSTVLHFHTNATQFTDEILDILACFKRNDHDFSIDGTGLVYEYIRHGSSFDLINQNIWRYLHRIKPNRLLLVMTVNALNVLDIGNYIDWVRSFNHPFRIHFQPTWPIDRGIAIHHMPVHLIEKARDRLLATQPDPGDIDTNLLKRLQQCIEDNKINRNKMLKEIQLFDTARNQSYRDYLDRDLVDWLDGI